MTTANEAASLTHPQGTLFKYERVLRHGRTGFGRRVYKVLEDRHLQGMDRLVKTHHELEALPVSEALFTTTLRTQNLHLKDGTTIVALVTGERISSGGLGAIHTWLTRDITSLTPESISLATKYADGQKSREVDLTRAGINRARLWQAAAAPAV